MNSYFHTAYQLSCPHPHPPSYLASLEFLELSCHIGSVINLIISSYGLFLIITKSPPAMKSAVPFMINLAASTMICDFTWSVLILPMFFMPLIAAHSSGVVSWFETTNPKIIIWLAFGTLGGQSVALLLLFEQRHRSIVTDSRFVIKRKSTKYLYYFALYAYFLNFGAPEILTAPEDQELAKLNGLKLVPCPPEVYFTNHSVVFQSDASLFNIVRCEPLQIHTCT